MEFFSLLVWWSRQKCEPRARLLPSDTHRTLWSGVSLHFLQPGTSCLSERTWSSFFSIKGPATRSLALPISPALFMPPRFHSNALKKQVRHWSLVSPRARFYIVTIVQYHIGSRKSRCSTPASGTAVLEAAPADPDPYCPNPSPPGSGMRPARVPCRYKSPTFADSPLHTIHTIAILP